jgi:nickel/cobalt transporter (NicO) family protein
LNSDKKRRVSLYILFLGLFLSPLLVYANPFLGSPEDKNPAMISPGPSYGFLIDYQMSIKDQMADLFITGESGDSSSVMGLLYGLSFLYGLLHAAGPGHRKTVVFSIFLSRKAQWYEPLIIGVLLSILHGGCAVLLILLFRNTAGPLLSRQLDLAAILLEGWTFVFLALYSLFLLLSTINHHKKGHDDAKGSKGSLLSVIISGFFPCPGAIMILVFSLTLNMLPQGIIAVLFMSVGMAFPVSLAGYLAYWGKKGLFIRLKENSTALSSVSFITELGGYTILLLFSLLMAYPFLMSYLR